jgi:hypothetical protein
MFTRRRFMAASAAASTTTMIAAPFVKTAHAAGKLSIGFWDHFVPDANKTSDALIQEWAAKEKVEFQIDRGPVRCLRRFAASQHDSRRRVRPSPLPPDSKPASGPATCQLDSPCRRAAPSRCGSAGRGLLRRRRAVVSRRAQPTPPAGGALRPRR